MGTVKLHSKKLIIFVAACLILAASISTAYFVMNQKSARRFYLESEGKNLKRYLDQVRNSYKDFYASQEPLFQNSYKNRLEISADIRSDGAKPFGFANASSMFDILRRCKIIMDYNDNPGAKKTLTNLALLMEKTPLLDAAVYTKDGRFGFNVPVLLPDKYFTFDINRINAVYDRYYKRYDIPPIRPERLFRIVDIAKTVQYSDVDMDKVIREYGTLISGVLEDSDVQYRDNVKVKVGSEEVSAREVVVTLGNEKTKKLMKSLIDKVCTDETLMKLTYENYTDVVKLLDESGLFQVIHVLDDKGFLKLSDRVKAFLEQVNIKKDVDGFKRLMKEFGEGMRYPEGLKMELTLDKKGNILGRNVSIPYTNEKNEKHAILIRTGCKDIKNNDFNNLNFELILSNISTGEDSTLSFNSNILPAKSDDKKGKVDMEWIIKKGGKESYNVQLKLDINKNTDEITLKRNSVIQYALEFKQGGSEVVDKFSGEVNTKSWKNNKRKIRNSNTVITVQADLPSMNLKSTTLKLNLAKELKMNIEDFTLPQVNEANSIDLINITDNDLIKIEDQGLASFGLFYLKNKSIIDTFTGK